MFSTLVAIVFELLDESSESLLSYFFLKLIGQDSIVALATLFLGAVLQDHPLVIEFSFDLLERKSLPIRNFVLERL